MNDVRLWRNEKGEALASVPQAVIHHSPDGFEWGYHGSGPADLALNILHAFLPPGREINWNSENEKEWMRDDAPERVYRGMCSRLAWKLHQQYKQEVIANLPHDGGVLLAKDIEAWIAANRDLP